MPGTPDLALGTLREQVEIPGGHGAARTLRRGQLLEIVDCEGQQVADLVAFAERNRTEWLSTAHTRSALMRLSIRVGDQLVSNWRNPMFEVLHDDVGIHDIITQMCDERRYHLDYGVSGHRSCRSNLAEALRPWGLADWQVPDPVNVFQNAPILPDRGFGNAAPTSRAGDRIVMGVLMDVVVGVSACPQDLNPCNGFRPSPILLRIREGAPG